MNNAENLLKLLDMDNDSDPDSCECGIKPCICPSKEKFRRGQELIQKLNKYGSRKFN